MWATVAWEVDISPLEESGKALSKTLVELFLRAPWVSSAAPPSLGRPQTSLGDFLFFCTQKSLSLSFILCFAANSLSHSLSLSPLTSFLSFFFGVFSYAPIARLQLIMLISPLYQSTSSTSTKSLSQSFTFGILWLIRFPDSVCLFAGGFPPSSAFHQDSQIVLPAALGRIYSHWQQTFQFCLNSCFVCFSVPRDHRQRESLLSSGSRYLEAPKTQCRNFQELIFSPRSFFLPPSLLLLLLLTYSFHAKLDLFRLRRKFSRWGSHLSKIEDTKVSNTNEKFLAAKRAFLDKLLTSETPIL